MLKKQGKIKEKVNRGNNLALTIQIKISLAVCLKLFVNWQKMYISINHDHHVSLICFFRLSFLQSQFIHNLVIIYLLYLDPSDISLLIKILRLYLSNQFKQKNNLQDYKRKFNYFSKEIFIKVQTNVKEFKNIYSIQRIIEHRAVNPFIFCLKNSLYIFKINQNVKFQQTKFLQKLSKQTHLLISLCFFHFLFQQSACSYHIPTNITISYFKIQTRVNFIKVLQYISLKQKIQNKSNMPTIFSYRQHQKIEFSDIRNYVDSLDLLTFFASAVNLQASSSFLSLKNRDLELAKKYFVKAQQKHGIKVMRILRTLCMRYINEGRQFNQLHCFFLDLIIATNVYKEALPLIDSKVFPDHELGQMTVDYFYNVMYINLQLRRYKKAEQALNIVLPAIDQHMKRGTNPQEILDKTALLLTFGLLTNSIGKYQQKIYMILQSILNWVQDKLSMNRPTTNRKDELVYKVDLLQIMIREPKKILSMEDQHKLFEKQKICYDIYQNYAKSCFELRAYIQAQISRKNERYRANDIKDKRYQDFDTMRLINLFGNMAKYDHKQRLIYLNHKKYTQEEINQLISRCYQMYECINREQGKSKEKDKESRSMGMGMGMGMGGMFGGMRGRMGGFGF